MNSPYAQWRDTSEQERLFEAFNRGVETARTGRKLCANCTNANYSGRHSLCPACRKVANV